MKKLYDKMLENIKNNNEKEAKMTEINFKEYRVDEIIVENTGLQRKETDSDIPEKVVGHTAAGAAALALAAIVSAIPVAGTAASAVASGLLGFLSSFIEDQQNV